MTGSIAATHFEAKAKLDLAHYPKRSDFLSLLIVVGHLGLGLAPIFLAASWGPGWHLIPLWLWFGLVMNGLVNLMHEAAHLSVFRARFGSELLGHWVLAPLTLVNFDAYRKRHWDHHRYLGTDADTKEAYLVDVRGWRLLGFFLSSLFLVEAVRKFLHQLARGEVSDAPKEAASLAWLVRGAVVQLLLFAALFGTAAVGSATTPGDALLAAACAYFVVYHYGLASLTVFMATLRAIAEHQVDAGTAVVVGRAALRNFHDDPISRLLLGAYGFSEHATHHLHPQCPSYQLRRVTTDLIERGRDDLVFGPGYVPTLFRLARR